MTSEPQLIEIIDLPLVFQEPLQIASQRCFDYVVEKNAQDVTAVDPMNMVNIGVDILGVDQKTWTLLSWDLYDNIVIGLKLEDSSSEIQVREFLLETPKEYLSRWWKDVMSTNSRSDTAPVLGLVCITFANLVVEQAEKVWFRPPLEGERAGSSNYILLSFKSSPDKKYGLQLLCDPYNPTFQACPLPSQKH